MSFPADQVYCVIDYETYSEAPLKKTGAFEYSVHPSTEILCVAYRIGTRAQLAMAKTRLWAPGLADTQANFGDFLRCLRDKSIILVAHNALFEQVITRNVFATKYMPSKRDELQAIPPERWICTASLAAVLALPRKLEHAARALKLPVQKDLDGHKLMMKWCKPKKPTKKDPSTRCSDPKELRRLCAYCVTDTDAEVGIFLKLPPLSAKERKIWILDQVINLRGFLVDRPLVGTALKLIAKESIKLNSDTDALTFGQLLSATQRDGVMSWLATEGITLDNLRKKTVEDTLKRADLPEDARRMLELRLAISKTSTAKYQAFELRSRFDGRARDNYLYSGAGTRRWAGMGGVQPQNFPRGSLKDSVQASNIMADGDLELIRMIYGDPMTVFSSTLRNMIIAPPGKILNVADYAAIETRVLFWFARHEEGIQAFVEGRDLYCEQASDVFGVPTEEIKRLYKAGDVHASFMRFIGKGLILGCGYSMGWKKFVGSCDSQGEKVENELAELAVKSYREKHAPVVKLWDNISRAAMAAVQNPGKRYTINRVSWYVKGDFLYCDLPSGGKLAYYGPHIRMATTPWGEKRPVLHHFGLNGVTRQFGPEKTYGGKLVENIVQSFCRDLMADAMIRIEEAGPWQIIGHSHDELIAERDPSIGGSSERFNELMAQLPEYAEGCPIKVEGWEGQRYKK